MSVRTSLDMRNSLNVMPLEVMLSVELMEGAILYLTKL